jgi:hypothetical protein
VGEFNPITDGSVLCSTTPVSPVTPFKVIVSVLPVGGIIVTDFGVVPPAGGVIVFNPLARVTISIWPGEDEFAAALND